VEDAAIFLSLLLIALVIFTFVGAVMGMIALSRHNALPPFIAKLSRRIEQLESEVRSLRSALESSGHVRPPEKAAAPGPEAAPVLEAAVPPPLPAPPAIPEIPVAEPPRAQPTAQEWWRWLEESVGRNWITWAGALALFGAVGFFVKLAFNRGWLGPTARVSLGIAFGLILVGAGERFIRHAMRPLGQGLIGGGLACLYVSLFAARGFYELISHPTAFALMAIVTAGGMGLAVVHRAIPISVLATVGGFLTPLLLRTGRDPRDALFTYLLLLSAGVLLSAFWRRWRFLDLMALAGSWAYFAAWHGEFYDEAAALPASAWVCGTFVFFLAPILYHVWERTPIHLERLLCFLGNGAIAFFFAHHMLYGAWNQALALITIGMGAIALSLAFAIRKRIRADDRAVLVFIVASITFLTIALPIQFSREALTIAWAAEAPILLALGYRYPLVRWASILPLLLAGGRICEMHWPLHAGPFSLFLNVTFGATFFVAVAGFAFALIHHRCVTHSTRDEEELKRWLAIASGFLALFLISAELWQWLTFEGRTDDPRWVSSTVWVSGAFLFLVAGIFLGSCPARASGLVALSVAGGLLLVDYTFGMREGMSYLLNPRFVASLGPIAILCVYSVEYLRFQTIVDPAERKLVPGLVGLAIVLLAMVLSVETLLWFRFHDRLYTGCGIIPFFWAAGALAFLGAGVALPSAPLRSAVSALLAVGASAALLGFQTRAPEGTWIILNLRFAAGVVVALAIGAYARASQRLESRLGALERPPSMALIGAAIVFAAVFLSVETQVWFGIRNEFYTRRCLLPLIWLAAAAGCMYSGFTVKSASVRFLGLALVVVAGLFAAAAYGWAVEGQYLLFVNGRFLAAALVVGGLFAYGYAVRRFATVCREEERGAAKLAYAAVIATLLLLLSFEAPLYFLNMIDDPKAARWAATMALSIVWAAYAIGLLAIGFWRSVRLIRLCALALFGLTAVKLVAVDLASLEDVYRIASFFVVGSFMIGASYLYHRVEKWLGERAGA